MSGKKRQDSQAEYNLVNKANFHHLSILLFDFYSSFNNRLARSLQLSIVAEVKSFKSFPNENKSPFRFQQFTSNPCHPTCDFQPKSPAGIITIIMLHNAARDFGYEPHHEKTCPGYTSTRRKGKYANLCSQISPFVVGCLGSVKPLF